MADWTANEAYIMESSGDVCTVSGRTFTKVNEGKALVASFHITSGYTGPLLVSTDPNAVAYKALSKTLTYESTIEYLGMTWYVSSTGYFMAGNLSVSGFAQKIGSYADNVAAAQALFEIAEVKLIVEHMLKYLIESENVIYTVADGTLKALEETEITASLFSAYGVDEIPNGNLIVGLANPKIMRWTDAEEINPLTATVTATPQPQIIISDKIHLTDKSITGIESALATCEGDLIVAVSFDDKQTWKAWNGEQWVTLSDDNTGMSKETLEGITFEQWNGLYTGATGFYVRVSLLDATQSVEKIVFDFAN